jgi:branched-subunit amino acid aminotransferase/4-amino-4-deoxychorismate lyase
MNHTMSWVFLNGHFLEEEKALVPVTDRGFLFGDGVFTTARVSDGKVEFLDRHLKRLEEQCQCLNIEFPFICPASFEHLIQLNCAQKGVWRLKMIITGGVEEELRLPKRQAGQILFLLRPYSLLPFQPIHLSSFPLPVGDFHHSIKSLCYLTRLSMKQFASEKGVEDVLASSQEGYVTETAFSNFFGWDGKTLLIPDPSLPYLKGIFLDWLMNESGFSFQFVKMPGAALPQVSFYTCNVLTYFRPVVEIQGSLTLRCLDFERRLAQSLQDFFSQYAT